MAATWSVVVHARQDIPQPLAFVTFRVVAVLIIGSLLGTTVSAVRRQRRLADMVCNASSDLIVSFDLHGTVRTVNPACEAILGYTQDELIGTDRAELIIDEDKLDGPPDIESLRRLGSRHVELQFTHKAGHSVWLELDLQPDLQEGFIYAIGRDVSERRQTEAELRHRVDHDALTGGRQPGPSGGPPGP
jgi:PAS domain S-box-containing protein